MKKQEAIPKIVVIFPTKNEEDTIEHVIRTAKKSQHRPEVIVIDAFSSDKTVRIARDNGAKVIQQDDRMFPAKGIAMGDAHFGDLRESSVCARASRR